jgi:hypothetical protein
MNSKKSNISKESCQVSELPCKQFIQSKLTIGPVNERFEQEADQVAEQVVQRKTQSQFFFKPVVNSISTIQRKCAACEKEEAQSLQRKENAESKSNVDLLVANARTSGGSPMEDPTRSFMESNFGYDFSNVKIHTNDVAAKSAQAINAHAYTSGEDIVFNHGQYSPDTDQGKKLLAHELTHVVQQNSVSNNGGVIQRKSIREDVAHLDKEKDGIYSGSVDRYEYENKNDYNERIEKNRENAFRWANVKVRFDSNQCVLEVPLSVNFINNDQDGQTHCRSTADRHRPIPQADFDKTASRLMSFIPNRLNNWFNIHLGNPQVTGCRGSEIPIKIVLTRETSNPDFEIILTANEGRSYARQGSPSGQLVLCGDARSEDDTIIHESAHMLLGTGDEYQEPGGIKSESRERPGEYSWMALDAPSRLRAFYERHFNFAAEFMNTVFPGCDATLSKGTKGDVTEITPYANIGAFIPDEGGYAYVSLGVRLGIPLTSMRKLSLMLGANLNLVGGMSSSDRKSFNMSALMMGFRAGLNYRKPLGLVLGDPWSLNLGIHAEGGMLYNYSDLPGRLPNHQGAPYGEVGGDVGFLTADSRIQFGAEGAKGIISPGANNPDINYYRIGFRFGVNF